MGKPTTETNRNKKTRRNRKPRNQVYQIRLNEDEADLFDMISYQTDDTKADVFRKALKMYAGVNGIGF